MNKNMKSTKTKSKIKHFEAFQKVCQVVCLFAFLAWFAKAIQDWAAWSTSTKWEFLYGDDDDDLVQYPILTFCNLPYFKNGAVKISKSKARFIWNAEISVSIAIHCYER